MGTFMNSKLALLGTVAALSLFSATQSSAHHQSWYVGIEAGGNYIDSNDFSFDNSNVEVAPFFSTMDFDTGWAALATIGYGFERNWRVELEAGYRSNDTNTFLVAPTAQRDGSLDEWSLMANVIYDIPLSDKIDLNLGIGAGADRATFDDSRTVKDSDVNFAYQAIVGLSYKLSSSLDLTLTYRYLNVDSPSFTDKAAVGIDSYNFEDVQKHTITVGLRYDLDSDEAPVVMTPPPPPPPPPPSVDEPEQFVIFFGYDKCNITNEANAVLGEAASAARTTGAVKISIVGHTDTMGSDAYNRKLSDCRADAARTNLVAKGIAADSISASGHGESELLVKTEDNVKEPQNRRATIDLNK